MKKNVGKIIGGIIVLLLVWFGYVYYQDFRGVKPAISEPDENITELVTKYRQGQIDKFPLKFPENFSVAIFAQDLPKIRDMVFDSKGTYMWVSQTKEGIISKLKVENYDVVRQDVIFENLNNPHGLAFDPADDNILYVAEEDKLSKVNLETEKWQKLLDLPTDGVATSHFTRTIVFGPDGRLYLSVGSSCNVCEEKENFRAKIISMNKNGGDVKVFASGLRNSVFFAWHPVTREMWATENGRDRLGDDLPPDEINIIKEGQNYGWPICYGKNVHDTDFDKKQYLKNPCEEPEQTESYIDLPAHVAPLGLAFVPANSGWPEEYWGDLLVAKHGSWNRSEPVGYNVTRIKLDENGNYKGSAPEMEDFVSGWLTKDNESLGRPVDLYVENNGIVYISDDKAGVIYKVSYIK